MSGATLFVIARMAQMSLIANANHHITFNVRMDIAWMHGRGAMEMPIAVTTPMNCTVLPVQESFNLNAK